MAILGISAFYHDSAAALIEGEHILAAAQEERFTRLRHDASYPRHAIDFCLKHAGINPADIQHVVFYEKPFLTFERLLETYFALAPSGFASFRRALPLWLKEKCFQKQVILKELKKLDALTDWRSKLLFAAHHESHAASAFYPSPFEEAAIICMDGVGEWATTSIWHGQGNTITPLIEQRFPHSLGLLYSAFTSYCGFKVNSGEYKLMGLAPLGKPVHTQRILDHLIDIKPDGSFRLNMHYFNFAGGLTMTNHYFHALFGLPPRAPESPISAAYCDVAASIQSVLELAVLRLAAHARELTGAKNLCLSGGVALNCTANGMLTRSGLFDDMWIQPAAGDAGGALGAALTAHHRHLSKSRTPQTPDSMQGALLGPSFTQEEIETALTESGATFETLSDDALIARASAALASGQIIGWHQGRMEFGPRALGSRSILADARNLDMKKKVNEAVKFRESFRPFAPSVLAGHAASFFAAPTHSPYMITTSQTLTKDLPATTHQDGSARLHTVSAESNPRFHALLEAFHRSTGCPVLLNTSFNVRGEPLVNTPQEAFACFMGSGLDALAIGNCWLQKSAQTHSLSADHARRFEPD